MTTAQIGLAASLFFIGYILIEVPSNMMLHRVGARLWISRIIVTWGIVTALTGRCTPPVSSTSRGSCSDSQRRGWPQEFCSI